MIEPERSRAIVHTLRECRDSGVTRTEARRQAFAAIGLDISQHGLTEYDTRDIDGFLNAIYTPHGCALCGATDVYLFGDHHCPEHLDPATVTGPEGPYQ